MGSIHIPVMIKEVVAQLQASKQGDYLDCTFGGGGHSRAILSANPANRVVALDRDLSAVERGQEALGQFAERLELLHGNFSQAQALVGAKRFDGILADLGLSSDQLEESRGFSFKDEGPLDMRMDRSQELTAAMVVNDYSESELFKVLKEGGVGQEARSICRAIISARPIQAGVELARVVNTSIRPSKTKKTNPATVTFQAIRMAVNQEIESIQEFLRSAPELAKPGGRLAIITFHSLEDKAVARVMRDWQGEFSASWPGRESKALGQILTGKAIVPSVEEVASNSRARSARLRVFRFC